jgi:uncharacterized protein YPO0396
VVNQKSAKSSKENQNPSHLLRVHSKSPVEGESLGGSRIEHRLGDDIARSGNFNDFIAFYQLLAGIRWSSGKKRNSKKSFATSIFDIFTSHERRPECFD